MTPEKLSEWKKLAEAATEGPWFFAATTDRSIECARDESGTSRVVVCGRNWDAESYDPGSVSGIADLDDGDFIAAARTAVPELIAEVEWLQRKNEELQQIVDDDRAIFQERY